MECNEHELNIDDVNGDGKYDVNDFLNMKNEDILKENNSKKFDIVLMNPPYDNRIHHKFLSKCIDISNIIVSIQPTSWIAVSKQDKKITNKINDCYVEIEMINGNNLFDAGFFGNVGITYINKLKDKKIIFNGKFFNNIEDVNLVSLDKYLEEFKNKIGEHKDNIWEHIKHTEWYGKGYEEHPNENWWCLRLSELRGNINKTKSIKESDDFYTLISNNSDFIQKNKGQYKVIKKIPNNKGKYVFGYFAFNTEQELNNFINYIKTDFVRTCLKLTKIHSNQFRGCMKSIPWFDFSDEHFSKSPREIDNWLFKKYNISDEIRKHIEEILPDYYKIRES